MNTIGQPKCSKFKANGLINCSSFNDAVLDEEVT